MGLGRLEISLENEAGVFYAGNELRGVVRIEINGSSKRIRGTVAMLQCLSFNLTLLVSWEYTSRSG